MNITPISARQLTELHLKAWAELLQSGTELDSPFFRPEFTQAVAAVRDGVEVAVLEEGGQIVGFLPFQRSPRNEGQPVGFPMNDFQGVIGDSIQFSPMQFVRDCGLRVFDFDHILSSQTSFSSHSWRTAESPIMDLSGGYDEYYARRANPRSREIKTTLRRMRKATREVGDIRFRLCNEAPSILAYVIDKKREQFRRTNTLDIFNHTWTEDLLKALLHYHTPHFSAVLSTLHIGDRLAAAHFGMRSNGVLHAWFPVFEHDLSRYSPGMIMWIKLAMEAQDLGITRVDLGKGDARYKTALMTRATTVSEGFVTRSPTATAVRLANRHARQFVRDSLLAVPMRRIRKALIATRNKLEI